MTIFKPMVLTEYKAYVGNKPLNVRVLTSERDKARGYQFAKTGPDDRHGLLFVFTRMGPQSFHMRNVGFDLDLLAFDAAGKFIGVVPMSHKSFKTYKTPPCMYALEVAPGWGSHLKKGISRLRFR